MPNKTKSDSYLLSTKLEIPSVGQKIIRRNCLIDLLIKGTERSVTIIEAPTGYGKTTLLADWLSTDPGLLRHTAWVSLDPLDNSAYRFWSYVIAAITRVAPHLNINLQHILLLESDPPHLEELNPLINTIAKLSFQLTLVLDDLQSVDQDSIFCGLTYLIEHQPKNLHIILASRKALPLPLGRLRAQGRLVEINEQDLSFSIYETQSYFSSVLEINLNQETMVALQQITEGWIAGLQLAAISLKNQPALNYSIAGLSTGNKPIFTYLTEEVLNQQNPDIREFLLKTCMLTELSAPLCDELLGRNNSKEIIIDLERSNLFINSVDKQHKWFRYHPLFANALMECLQQEYPDQLPNLHRRACTWLASNGFPEKAVSHALAAGDLDIAAEIADSYALQAIINYDLTSLIYWTDRFSINHIAKYPKLGIYSAVASCQLSRVNKVESELHIVEQVLEGLDDESREKLVESHLRWEIAAIRAAVDCIRGDFSKAIPTIISLLQEQPEDDLFFGGWLNHFLARAYEALKYFNSATERYNLGRRFAQQNKMHNMFMHTTSALIHLYKVRGCLNQAEIECHLALDYADRENLDYRHTILPQIYLTEIRQERSVESIEATWVDKVIAQFDQIESGPLAVSTKFLICLELTKFYLTQQEIDHALHYLNKAVETFIPGDAILFNMLSELVDLQVEIWAAMGDPQMVEDSIALEALVNKFGRLPSDAVQSALGWIYFFRGDLLQALQVLNEVEKDARETGMAERLLRTIILKALCFSKTGQPGKAMDCLDEAVGWVEKEGYLRIFHVEGEACKSVIVKSLEELQAKSDHDKEPERYYVSKLIEALNVIESKAITTNVKTKSPDIVVSLGQAKLSNREKDVFRLLEIGKSTKEIAVILMISVNTAKTHVRSIHRKIGRKVYMPD